jgi:hypothetical protein
LSKADESEGRCAFHDLSVEEAAAQSHSALSSGPELVEGGRDIKTFLDFFLESSYPDRSRLTKSVIARKAFILMANQTQFYWRLFNIHQSAIYSRRTNVVRDPLR